MARKKFNFEAAMKDTASALAGGIAASQVEKLLAENLPDYADKAMFGPVALGFYLSQQKNDMLQAVGLGMIGAAAPSVASEFGINGAGVGRTRYKLTEKQKAKALEEIAATRAKMNQGVRVAGAANPMNRMADAQYNQ